jgi:hypothetical protein
MDNGDGESLGGISQGGEHTWQVRGKAMLVCKNNFLGALILPI